MPLSIAKLSIMALLNIFTTFYNEVVSFLGIGPLLNMYQQGDYSQLSTARGIKIAISPAIPFLLIIEIVRAAFYKRFTVINYKVPFIIYVFNRFVGQFISVAAIAYCISLFEKHSLIKTSFTWYWLIYALVVWELSHFIYHFLAHKIRLLWCMHSTHHAPEAMNLSVHYTQFLFEAPYVDFLRTTICLLLGVSPPLLFFIMFIDGAWVGFIHIGENMLKDGRLGFLNKFILTPSHHRVHHARNPTYIDTNFCNLINIWDILFGTLQNEDKSIPIEYGITRNINPNSFWDVYFGEIIALGKDVYHAPGLKNKLLYIVMPPGWSHTGNHKTAKAIRRKYLKEAAARKSEALEAEVA